MEEYENTINKIKLLLKDDIRGMTVTDIANRLDMSRTSIGKYLDILLVSGFVEVKKFGSAKVYFLSDRIPLSTMLNFTSDQIIVLDRNFSILQVNQAFLDAWKFEREDLIGKNLKQINLAFTDSEELFSNLKEALNGNEKKMELDFRFEDKNKFLEIKFVPTIFETGYPGITLIVEDTTERKQQELLLKESEEQFRRQFENNLIPAYLWKKIEGENDFVLVDYNKTGYEITNGKVKDFLNIKASEMYGTTHTIFQDMNTCYTTESSFQREMDYEFTTKELKIFNVQYTYVSQKHIVVYTEDITKRKETEKSLQESEKNYHNLVENIPVVIWKSTKTGEITFLSPNITKITGYSHEEMIKGGYKEWFEKVHPKTRDDVIKHYQSIFRDGGVFDIEYQVQHKNGSWIWIHDKVITVEKENNQLTAYGVFGDITEQKKTEILLKESEEKFRTISESNPIAMVIGTLEGKMIYYNDKFKEITGYNDEEIITSNASIYYADPNARSRVMKAIENDKGVKSFNLVLKRKNGELYDVILNSRRTILNGETVNVSTLTEWVKHKE